MLVQGLQGERVIAFSDFHRLPGNAPERDTNLAADEIITAVELPANGFAKNHTYLKIRDRLSYAFRAFPSHGRGRRFNPYSAHHCTSAGTVALD